MAKVKPILDYISFMVLHGRRLKNPKKAQKMLFKAWYQYIDTGDDTLLMMLEIHFGEVDYLGIYNAIEYMIHEQ